MSSRTLLLITLLFLAMSSPALAQRWEGSIKLGGGSTTFRGDFATGETNWDRRWGFAAGASVGYKLRYGFTPAVEFSYLRMGATTAVRYLEAPATLSSELAYLTTSLLLQYRIYTGRYVYPRIFAGPSVSYTLSALISVAARDERGVLLEADDSVESSDFGFTVGGGLDFEIGSQIITFEVRYYTGQRDITKPNPDLGDSSLQNVGIIVMVGVLF